MRSQLVWGAVIMVVILITTGVVISTMKSIRPKGCCNLLSEYDFGFGANHMVGTEILRIQQENIQLDPRNPGIPAKVVVEGKTLGYLWDLEKVPVWGIIPPSGSYCILGGVEQGTKIILIE